MKNNPFYFSLFLVYAAFFSVGCREQKPDNILTRLKENGKISTYSLTFVTTNQIDDAALENIRTLSIFSGGSCKALADAGILRLGSNIYYPYNTIADLKIDESIENDEDAIGRSVEEQVKTYFSKSKPKDYDSLTSPNPLYYNERELLLSQLSKPSSDSLFFFSPSASPDGQIQVGGKFYPVYNNAIDLRNHITELVCKGQGTISVFYNPPLSLQSNSGAQPSAVFPARGTPAGDTCIGTSKFQRIHDGFGAYMAGRLIEANSVSCGGVVEPEKAPEVIKPKETAPKSQPSAVPPPKIKPTDNSRKEGEPKAAPQAADNRCARKSDPTCEIDDAGNYTGRRVQYCYNSAGKIIKTITLSKCDVDCRCF